MHLNPTNYGQDYASYAYRVENHAMFDIHNGYQEEIFQYQKVPDSVVYEDKGEC